MTRFLMLGGLFLALLAPAANAADATARAAFSVEVSGSGPPVILIPGLACDGEVWRATVEHERRHHRMHVLTLAGFAGQPALDGPLLPVVRAQLAEYIRRERLDRPVLVGHSLGGFLALWLAATEPDLVGGVVVVDALPFLPAFMDPSVTAENVKPQAEQMRAMLAAQTPEAFAAQNRRALGGMITDTKKADAVAARSRGSDPRAVAQAVYELMVTDLRPQLASIRAPVLVLAAGAMGAAAVARVTYPSQYQKLHAHQLLIDERARHFVMLDDPAWFERELDRFLSTLSKGA